MKKLRILFIASGFFKVGDYFRFKAFGETLAQAGHSVSILTGDLRIRLSFEREFINGVEWLYPPYFGGVELSEKFTDYLPETKIPYDILFRIYFLLRYANNYDVVHGFHVGFNTFLPLVSTRWLKSRRPVIVFDWCDLWDGGIIQPPSTGFFKKADYRCSVALEPLSVIYSDGITVNNTYLAKKAEEFGAPGNRIKLIQDGAATDEIKPIDKRIAKQRLEIDPDLFVLGFSGFFHPDTMLLLEAFAKVKAKTQDNVRLLFIGSINSSLLQLICERGLTDSVIYVGPIAHEMIGEYLGACDLLLLPFTSRPVNLGRWPFKLGDYLSAGRPIVAGAFGDVKEFFNEHPNIGITCDETAESFAEAILKMKNAPELLERAMKEARNVAVNHMKWENKMRVLERFYFKLLENKTSFYDYQHGCQY